MSLRFAVMFILLAGCGETVAIQKEYVGHRDNCQKYAETKVDWMMSSKTSRIQPKDKNAALVQQFNECMATKNWDLGKSKEAVAAVPVVPVPTPTPTPPAPTGTHTVLENRGVGIGVGPSYALEEKEVLDEQADPAATPAVSAVTPPAIAAPVPYTGAPMIAYPGAPGVMYVPVPMPAYGGMPPPPLGYAPIMMAPPAPTIASTPQTSRKNPPAKSTVAPAEPKRANELTLEAQERIRAILNNHGAQ